MDGDRTTYEPPIRETTQQEMPPRLFRAEATLTQAREALDKAWPLLQRNNVAGFEYVKQARDILAASQP